jgi:hypothetical protein
MASATLVRGLTSLHTWRPRWIMIACGTAACVIVLLIISVPVGVVTLLIALGAAARPVLFRLKHGRVWELRPAGASERARCVAWAVIVPHPMDQKTWRLDITLHPLRKDQPGWADPLIESVNAAADIFDVSIQSMDPYDEPVLRCHGYLPAETLHSQDTVLERFPSPHEMRSQNARELRELRELVSENRRELIPLRRLTDETLACSEDILSRPSLGWDEVVLQRTGALWELARAAAIGLDGYVESLSLRHLDPASFPEGSEGLDARLDRLRAVLQRSADQLRASIADATEKYSAGGGEPLQWAQDLALLEIEALSLAGLVAHSRRGRSVTLPAIEQEMQHYVLVGAKRVREKAKSLRSRSLFDTTGIIWWTFAIVGDAFDLCGHRLGRLLIRSAIRKLEVNDLRHMVVLARELQIGESEPLSDDPVERLERVPSVTHRGKPPGRTLADLSATRTRRIGVARGAEGLRDKRLRQAISALTINNLLLLLAGLAVWLLVVGLRNMSSGRFFGPLASVIAIFQPDRTALERVGSSGDPTFDLSVSSNLARETTLALLAVVITGAVAVAVANPRESSTRLWAQDRAWQLFIVTVGYGASTAALVLALAPLQAWQIFSVNERAEALAALGFAILTACAATSASALSFRLDARQQQRRALTAYLRLRRANDRLGPPPAVIHLVGRAVVCFAFCTLPLELQVVRLSETPEDFWWLSVALNALNVIPMVMLTMLFVIKWANDWGLAGRVAIATLFALAIALLAYEALYVTALWVDVVALFFLLSPVLLLWLALVLARALATNARVWTGPATFALHIAVRFGRWNYRRNNA